MITPAADEIWVVKDDTGERMFAQFVHSEYTFGGRYFEVDRWEFFGADRRQIADLRPVCRVLSASDVERLLSGDERETP